MYKTKIWIWLSMAAVAFALWGFPKLGDALSMEATPVTININTNDTILNETDSFSRNDEKFTFKVSGRDSTVLVRESSLEQITGYKKYSGLYYTPIVMFARHDAKEDNSGFKLVDSDSTSSAITKDLGIFLDAIIEGKTFEDLGISKDVATGKVRLYIPKKGTAYYKYVEDLIYITLNGGIIPNEADKKLLQKNFDTVMANCTQVEDIQQLLYDAYKEPSKHKDITIVLGPEKIFEENQYFLNPGNSTDAWNIVYPTYTVANKYDVFVKELPKTTDKKESDEITEKDIMTLLKSSVFSNATGLRTDDGDFSFNNNVRSRSIDNLKIMN